MKFVKSLKTDLYCVISDAAFALSLCSNCKEWKTMVTHTLKKAGCLEEDEVNSLLKIVVKICKKLEFQAEKSGWKKCLAPF